MESGHTKNSRSSYDIAHLCIPEIYIQTWGCTAHACHGCVCNIVSVRSSNTWRSWATFQGWPLTLWGPKQGQRGSNTGIVLYTQHIFSLQVLRHGSSKTVPRLSERNSLTAASVAACMCTGARILFCIMHE